MHFMYGHANGSATETRRLYVEAESPDSILHIVCLDEFTKDCVIPVHWANNDIYQDQPKKKF